MAYIKINGYEKRLEDADPHWINRVLRGELELFGRVCVEVRFDQPGLHLHLSTPTCGGGGGKPFECFNRDEQRLIELWRELGLSKPDFEPGNVIAFVQQVTRRFSFVR